MSRSFIQIIIWCIGFLFLCMDVYYLLHTSTLFIPSWILALFYIPILIVFCFGLGFITKRIVKSDWKTVSYAAIFLCIFSMVYAATEYSPSYEINVPEKYNGTVLLFVSRETENDFKINENGVGYISEKTYKSGFKPVILQGGKDITKEIDGFASGGFSTITRPGVESYNYNYISFNLPGNPNIGNTRDLSELIQSNAVDTTRLKR